MSPFRLFGPPPEPEPVVAPPDNSGGVTWAPGAWAHDPAPATRHARPVGLDTRSAADLGRNATPSVSGYRSAPSAVDDPPTDPFGFPPIPADPAPAWSAPVRPRPHLPEASPLDPREAAALAGAFAADYLSWDEDDPGRRGRVLAGHLAAPAGDPALLGWDGTGRQRAEFALPGAVRPDGDDRVLVDVRVRVTPHRAVGDRTSDEPEPEPDREVPGVPAAAPAPIGRGWEGCASYWVRLIVPVVREDSRLVVDAREETPPDEDRGVPDRSPGDRGSADRDAGDRGAGDRGAAEDPDADRARPPAERLGPGFARVADPDSAPESAW